jgi:nucleotide-binding universal stress UspA family protein
MTLDKVATQIAITNILFLTDFSVASTRAFPWACALARQNHATVHVAHVVGPAASYVDSQGDLDEDNIWLENVEAAKKNIKIFLQNNPLNGIRCEPIVGEGDLWKCVSRLIDAKKIDLIVVGTKGSTGLTKVMLGSGAEVIFREAPCPVMTIGPYVKRNALGEFKNILFPMEFKDTYKTAYPHALALAAENHGHLTVLHVVLPVNVEFGDRGMSEYKQHIRSLLTKELNRFTRYEKSSVPVNVVVESGSPPDVIVNIARELGSDLIVMSVHHASRLATHLPWAVAHEVVIDAPCPVITIRS